jgi:hypothetical protein
MKELCLKRRALYYMREHDQDNSIVSLKDLAAELSKCTRGSFPLRLIRR